MRLNTIYSIDKEKVASRVIDEEAVILNVDNGYYYSLNEVGTKVWQAIDGRKDVEGVIASIKDGYSVSEERLKKDVIGLLRDLRKEGLIEMCGPEDKKGGTE